MIVTAPMRIDSNDGPNPGGLCMCGCGVPTPIAPEARPRYGQVKGQPIKYVRGHNTRGRPPLNEEQVERIKEKLRGRSGELNPSWKGGRTRVNGRLRVYVGKDHPMANISGYVLEHRLIAAKALERMLRRDEHVHHINCDHHDNRIENLIILTGSEHARVHAFIRSGIDPTEALGMVIGCE